MERFGISAHAAHPRDYVYNKNETSFFSSGEWSASKVRIAEGRIGPKKMCATMENGARRE